MRSGDVDVPSGRARIGGYMARPGAVGPHPGVIVIHEVFGLNDNIKDITRRFADSGYVALAVDLFTGRNRVVCMARFMAGALSGSLNRYGVSDLKAALRYLSDWPDVDASRVGTIGFCMGGAFAIAWACSDDRLKAIAPFYGSNPRPLSAVARLCPVVGSYPGRDYTASGARKLDEALDGYGVPHDIKIYPGARHSFFNDRSRAYDPEAAADSWQRVLAFFEEHLRHGVQAPN